MKKIYLKSVSEVLSQNEMKKVFGGYDPRCGTSWGVCYSNGTNCYDSYITAEDGLTVYTNWGYCSNCQCQF